MGILEDHRLHHHPQAILQWVSSSHPKSLMS